MKRILVLVYAIVCAACATTAPAARATLQIACNVPEASVWVDDRYAGTAATWSKGVSVSAGFHRVELRHPSHFSFFAEVAPHEGELVKLAPLLRPTLD